MAKPQVGHLIGIPYAYNGRGPDTFDCLGLVNHLYEAEHPRRVLGKRISDNWSEGRKPEEPESAGRA